jgi:hypothetical protein
VETTGLEISVFLHISELKILPRVKQNNEDWVAVESAAKIYVGATKTKRAIKTMTLDFM